MTENKLINRLSNHCVGGMEKALLPLLDSTIKPLVNRHNAIMETVLNEVQESYFKLIDDINDRNEDIFTLKLIKVMGVINTIKSKEELKEAGEKLLLNKGYSNNFRMLFGASNHVQYKNKLLIELRMKEYFKKTTDIIHDYYQSGIDKNYDILLSNCIFYTGNYIKIKETIESIQEVEEKEEVKEVFKKGIETRKIFNYKDMNSYIESQGFKYVRSNGDHKIYSNGKISIPIPQHTLGKGLSVKIQKQIQNI